MDESLRIWLIIAAAACVTNLLRAGPVLLFSRAARTTSGVFRFLEYASYVIIGSLISASAVSPKTLRSPSLASVADSVVAIVVVGFSFALATRVRQPVVCLVAGLSLFLVLKLLWQLI